MSEQSGGWSNHATQEKFSQLENSQKAQNTIRGWLQVADMFTNPVTFLTVKLRQLYGSRSDGVDYTEIAKAYIEEHDVK